LQVEGGEMDLAGVELRGDDASVRVSRAARLIFSVSRVDSAIQRRYVRELVEAKAGEEW
jgi:hypothetical protein